MRTTRYAWAGRFISDLERGRAVAPLEGAMEIREVVESDVVSNLANKPPVQIWFGQYAKGAIEAST